MRCDETRFFAEETDALCALPCWYSRLITFLAGGIHEGFSLVGRDRARRRDDLSLRQLHLDAQSAHASHDDLGTPAFQAPEGGARGFHRPAKDVERTVPANILDGLDAIALGLFDAQDGLSDFFGAVSGFDESSDSFLCGYHHFLSSTTSHRNSRKFVHVDGQVVLVLDLPREGHRRAIAHGGIVSEDLNMFSYGYLIEEYSF